jgi:hypothetical protein
MFSRRARISIKVTIRCKGKMLGNCMESLWRWQAPQGNAFCKQKADDARRLVRFNFQALGLAQDRPSNYVTSLKPNRRLFIV